jgi:SHS2 domain-containing protein
VTFWADTLEALFTEAARVLSRDQKTLPETPGEWERITLSAHDTATLLVDWLNELLGRSEVRGRAYREVRDFQLDGGRLSAEVRGTPVVHWRSPLKAATYHGQELKRENGRWKATVLFDV